jgi:hypothetical protein
MIRLNAVVRTSLFTLAVLLIGACADYKTPAQETIAKAEAALQNVAREASKYAPDELKKLQDELAATKATFDQGDYQKALLAARQLMVKIPELATLSGTNRTAAMKQAADDWQKLSGTLPKMLDTIGARLAKLGKSHNPPAAYAQAKTDFDAAKQTLTEATSASATGNFEEAAAKAKAVEEKAKSIMAALGMKAA